VHGSNTRADPALLERLPRECHGGQLCVRRNGMPSKDRKFVVATGLGPDHNLGVYNNNTNTLERAFVERYFFCAEGGGFRPALSVPSNAFRTSAFRQFLHTVVNNMPNLPRLSRQQVVDRYTGRKRVIYEQALLSLQRKSLCDKDARLTSFVKFEKQDVSKAPRVINPRTPRYNLCLGRYLKHAEKPFFTAINEAFGGHTGATVIKGFNADKSAQLLKSKWDRFRQPAAVGLDATKFDMHVSMEALQYEHSFYKLLFPGSKELRCLLGQQLRNSGHAYLPDGQVDFKMRGTRCSGDLNTSLGNCLLMCAMIHVYARIRGTTIELANNGDDCVVFLERGDLTKFMRGLDTWFRGQGFAMVCEEPVFEFEQVEFCQTHPVQLSTGWRMMRNHTAVLRKDPMCLVPIQNDGVYQKWLYAVGECGLKLGQGCPVQQSFYDLLHRSGRVCTEGFKEAVIRGSTWAQRIDGLGTAEVTPLSRVSYYYAFGLLPDEQVELERFYREGRVGPIDLKGVERDALVIEPGIIRL